MRTSSDLGRALERPRKEGGGRGGREPPECGRETQWLLPTNPPGDSEEVTAKGGLQKAS